MKKLNKKGFTLVELLAVIVILAVLIVLLIPTALKTMDNAKAKTFALQAERYASAAQSAYTLLGTGNSRVYKIQLAEEDNPSSSIAGLGGTNTSYYGCVVMSSTSNMVYMIGKEYYITGASGTLDATDVKKLVADTATPKSDEIKITAAIDAINETTACGTSTVSNTNIGW